MGYSYFICGLGSHTTPYRVVCTGTCGGSRFVLSRSYAGDCPRLPLYNGNQNWINNNQKGVVQEEEDLRSTHRYHGDVEKNLLNCHWTMTNVLFTRIGVRQMCWPNVCRISPSTETCLLLKIHPFPFASWTASHASLLTRQCRKSWPSCSVPICRSHSICDFVVCAQKAGRCLTRPGTFIANRDPITSPREATEVLHNKNTSIKDSA